MSENDGRPGARVNTGRIKVHPDGFAFVVPDDHSEDIHVGARHRGMAMDSDRVEVEWWVGARGLEGRVLRIRERGRGKLTGQLGGHGAGLRFEPDDPRIQAPVRVRGGVSARAGQSVLAEITAYPENPGDPIEVMLLKVLGDPNDPRTEVEKTLACAEISDEFPAEVTQAALAMPARVQPTDERDRADLRHVAFVTIDPESARDFDDAVALESLPHGGQRLWVAVADVSHYVREGSALDAEARVRGVSVYLPNRAIPMLPEALSGHLCSLVPGEDRLAMVVRIDFDRRFAITDTDFCAAVIRSRARLDYPGVAAGLVGDTRGKRRLYEPFLASLRTMDALAKRLRRQRQARGALDLDLPQAVVELDRDDPRLVRAVRRARRDPGERAAYAMIEEFMLAANEAVGRSFQEAGEDTAWRIHEVPDPEKVASFAQLAERYGIRFDPAEATTPLGLAAVLKRLAGHPAEKPLSMLLLRALKQATYDVVNVGHFGLASPAYLHFTSPIRRYPDIIVHRLLKQRLAGQGKPAGGFSPASDTREPATEILRRAAADASFCERKAMEVEREVVDLYRAYFMRDRVGDVLAGSVSGVTSFGIFVALDEPFVEGLVRTDYLAPDDFYDFDEVACRLVGRRSGKNFSLGDRVEVEILQVSVARRRIELRLHDARAAGERTPAKKRRPEKPSRQARRRTSRAKNRRRAKRRT
ncbi:MAG: ribonuclease R [Deltaproteobacteria bacterium]|nr:ribonuclease R [Deltaproteobacteria bacterium]